MLDQAERALAVCARADAAKDIRDVATAFQTYAKAAKDTALIERATAIRFKAETTAGELLHDMKVKGRRDPGGRGKKIGSRAVTQLPTLDDLGITKIQASRWQRLAMTKIAFPDKWDEQLRKLCRLAVAVTEGNKAVIAEMRADMHREKQRVRDAHEQALAEKIYALPAKRFAVIYADPPWKFVVGSEKGMTLTAAANHYATSDLDTIAALDVDSIAATDAALFLWATQPMLDQALSVMVAWGFKYISHCIWLKNRPGTGFWFRNKHEILLLGTRGDIPAPAFGTQPESVIEAPIARHSEKPEIFAEMIEKMFPTVPKIELYRRGPARPGWSAWGAEAIQNDDGPEHVTEAASNFQTEGKRPAKCG